MPRTLILCLEDALKNVSRFISFVTLAAVLLLGACAKKPLPVPPPPTPPPPSPTASLTANPNSVQKGEATTLTWETTNATDVQIDGIGPVNAKGSQQVTPSDSTTYRLVAKGSGGSQEATARVTVTTPAPVTPTETPTSLTEEQMFNQSVKDIYFDYDKYDVSPAQQSSVRTTAQFFAAHPGIRFSVEGHCDERGSTEFNLALGDNRANAVKSALIQAGIPTDRIRTISYGKEKPFCSDHTEDCWQQNRRGHFVYQK
jgi:peptidoglycan-associated lipoprotein